MPKEDSKELMHICPLVDDPNRVTAIGSLLGKCYRCGRTVVASPASTAQVEEACQRHGLTSQILCIPCGMAYMNHEPEKINLLLPNKRCMDELREALKHQ